MKKNSTSEVVPFLYRAGFFGINIYLFFKLMLSAITFAKTWTYTYTPTVSRVLIVLFAVGFFDVFRNLTQLALSLEEDDTQVLNKMFEKLALNVVFLLLVILLVSIVPEFSFSIK